ncbi:MAG: hypothetical protein H6907_18575 [Hyphomicrobiales bacterium]|nr:hypothetical protein [Hyphomicrobiales bacterium]MCP5373739.1 hypothetical protein [Hyphomicrobiales bacterium]
MTQTLARVEAAVRAAGLTPRGAFHPGPGDGVPAAAPGRPAATLVLVGNAGPAMWAAFAAACDPDRDLLDDWSRRVVGGLARDLGAAACFPFDAPPLPFQRWARRAEPCHPSPLGIFIHARYGLWHGYRGALLFADRLDLPPQDPAPSPCDTCDGRPCLSACPVAAFTGAGYDTAACAGHLAADAGRDCMAGGCRARHACPVGQEYAYAPAQQRFHMAAFRRAMGRG